MATAPAPHPTTGQDLRDQREARGVTVQLISALMTCSPADVESLEADPAPHPNLVEGYMEALSRFDRDERRRQRRAEQHPLHQTCFVYLRWPERDLTDDGSIVKAAASGGTSGHGADPYDTIAKRADLSRALDLCPPLLADLGRHCRLFPLGEEANARPNRAVVATIAMRMRSRHGARWDQAVDGKGLPRQALISLLHDAAEHMARTIGELPV
ncbi:MAG: hypothetical protein ACYDAY_11535 [Candidatus Dormibacteria bacterium]